MPRIRKNNKYASDLRKGPALRENKGEKKTRTYKKMKRNKYVKPTMSFKVEGSIELIVSTFANRTNIKEKKFKDSLIKNLISKQVFKHAYKNKEIIWGCKGQYLHYNTWSLLCKGKKI